MILSPSTSFPSSSTTISLSPSPSNANPMSAFSFMTFCESDLISTAPQFLLMFNPSGLLFMAIML